MTKRKASVALEIGTESNQSSQGNNSDSAAAVTNGNPPSTQQNGSTSRQIGGNNQNDNSNSNSSSSNLNAGGGQNKIKKERSDNWSSAEIQVLHRGIETRRDIFYGPPNQATKKNRELAWEAITKEVNSISTTPRSLSQVMKKFKNEKCRAKRKFNESDKEVQNNLNSNISNVSNNNRTTTTTNNTSDATDHSGVQNHANSNQQPLQAQAQAQAQAQPQQQQQPHHMTGTDSLSATQTSINVVKLAPQNVTKTMIDLPGHVQQIQMPNDDMVLIVPPEMDGLLSGMNIVSDALNNHQHNHHGQHTIQALNNGQGLVNGSMSNGMMTRTIPAGSMCSLVYSTGGEVCGPDQHVSSSVTNPSGLTNSHLGVGTQTLMHHRGPMDQNQPQQQHHQIHQQQHPQQQQQQQQQAHQPSPQLAQHQPQQVNSHHHQQLPQNHSTTATTISSIGGVAVESQIKNLLFNLLLKDGQSNPSAPMINQSQDYKKQRNDMLAIIASSLNKIEGHLCKISKVASSLAVQNMNLNNSNIVPAANQINSANSSLNIDNNDGNNNVSMSETGSSINNQRGTDA